MPLTYLSLTSPTQVADNNGNALCSLAPDTGQYWLPTTLHTSNQNGNVCRADVYMGGPKGPTGVNPSFLKDTTFQGQNDTTSILSGLVVYSGQAINVQFTGAQPGDVLSFQITGINSSTPPPQEILPDIPGSRFTFTSPINLTRSIYLNANAPGPFNNMPDNSVATSPFPGFFVGDLNHVLVQFQPTPTNNGATGARLSLIWNNLTLNQSIQSATDTIDAANFNKMLPVQQTFAVKGEYLQLRVQTGATTSGPGINAFLLNIFAAPQPFYSEFPIGEISSMAYALNTITNVPAGTNQIQSTANGFIRAMIPGPALFYGGPYDQGAFNWEMLIMSEQYNLATQLVYRIDQRNQFMEIHKLYIPNTPIYLQVNNLDGANAHNFQYGLMRSNNYQYAD